MRRVVLVSLIFAVLGMFFSGAVTFAISADHDCAGDGCHICAVVNTLTFVFARAQFFLLALMVIPLVTAAVRFFCDNMPLPGEKTPVALCDIQNN